MAMIVSNETIYSLGLVLIGFSALMAAVIAPVLIITGVRLKRRLEDEYGKPSCAVTHHDE